MTKETFNRISIVGASIIIVLILLWVVSGWQSKKRIEKLEQEKAEVERLANEMDSLLTASLATRDSILMLFEESEAFDEVSREKLKNYVEDNYFIQLDGNELIDSSWSKLNRYNKNRQADSHTWDASRFNRPK